MANNHRQNNGKPVRTGGRKKYAKALRHRIARRRTTTALRNC